MVKDEKKHCSPLNEVQAPTRQTLSCPEVGCRRSFGHRQGLRAHIKNVHRKSLQGASEERCPFDGCSDVLKSTEEFQAHIKSVHSRSSGSNVEQLSCAYPGCLADFASRPILLKHLRVDHTSDRIECKECGTFYKDVYYLKKHNARKHSSQDLQCDQCEYRTSMMEDLKKHIDSKHDPTRHTCEFCGKDFAMKRGLDVHMIQKHSKEHKGQELLCNQCDYKVIGQPSKLEVHIETKHNSAKFTCIHCDFVFDDGGDLEAHMSKDHAGENAKKNEVVKSSERNRMEREARKDYPCKECGDIFKKRGALRHHRIAQHQNVTFSCPEDKCNFKTKHKALVKHHQKIKHMGLLKSCDLCNFKAPTKTRLDSHKINKHKVTPIVFSCNKCEVKHSSQEKMRKHMLLMH